MYIAVVTFITLETPNAFHTSINTLDVMWECGTVMEGYTFIKTTPSSNRQHSVKSAQIVYNTSHILLGVCLKTVSRSKAFKQLYTLYRSYTS